MTADQVDAVWLLAMRVLAGGEVPKVEDLANDWTKPQLCLFAAITCPDILQRIGALASCAAALRSANMEKDLDPVVQDLIKKATDKKPGDA